MKRSPFLLYMFLVALVSCGSPEKQVPPTSTGADTISSKKASASYTQDTLFGGNLTSVSAFSDAKHVNISTYDPNDSSSGGSLSFQTYNDVVINVDYPLDVDLRPSDESGLPYVFGIILGTKDLGFLKGKVRFLKLPERGKEGQTVV